MQEDIDLNYAMNLPPKMAIAYFTSKGYSVSESSRKISVEITQGKVNVLVSGISVSSSNGGEKYDRSFWRIVGTEHAFKGSQHRCL